MTNQYSLSKRFNLNKKRVITIIVFLIIIIAVVAPAGLWYLDKTESSMVLMQAKAVTLASNSIAMRYYGTAQKFADQTSACGLTPQARSDIKELSQADGEYYLLQWDKENFRVKMSAYVENGYTVIYQLDSEGTPGWKLYRTTLM